MAKQLDRMKGGGRHTVTVTLPVEDKAGVKTDAVLKVVYRGMSMEEGDAIEAKFEAEPDRRKALTQALSESVIEIVDDGEVVNSTPELWSGLDTYFLNRINAAVKVDRQGPNE